MKRAITILLALMMVLSLAGCGGGSTTTETPAPTGAADVSKSDKENVPAPADAPVSAGNNKPAELEDSYAIPSIDSAKELKEGECGDSAIFSLYDNGVLVIDGTGSVEFEFNQYNKYVQYLLVEEGITKIGNKAFIDCENLQVVECPESLEIIGVATFKHCTNLASVKLSKGLNTIEKNAFNECYKLKSIEIPSTVKSLGESAFEYCGLENLIIRKGLPEIPKSAFRHNEKLGFIVIPGSVRVIGEDAFRECQVGATVILCNGVQTIKANAFEKLKVLAVPDSVQKIEYNKTGTPNLVHPSECTIYCNSVDNIIYESNADTIVGYDGFIKNYNLSDYT